MDAAPIPPKNPSGTEITNEQGQEITRKIQALCIHETKSPPKNNGGIIARIAAQIVTNGVYTLAKRVIKFSTFAFLLLAFSTSSNIFATVESSKAFVTRIFKIPFPFMHPLTISLPS